MENKHIFNSYGFNVALAMLLLNDFILKDLYGNWLTGKLSNFAELSVFSLFFIVVFPNSPISVSKRLVIARMTPSF